MSIPALQVSQVLIAQGTAQGAVEVTRTTGFVIGAKVTISWAGVGVEARVVGIPDLFTLILRDYSFPIGYSGSDMTAFPIGARVVQAGQTVTEQGPDSPFFNWYPLSQVQTYSQVSAFSEVLLADGVFGYVQVANPDSYVVGSDVTLTSNVPLSATALKISRISNGNLYLTDMITGLPFDASAFKVANVAALTQVAQFLVHNATWDTRLPPLNSYEMTALNQSFGLDGGGLTSNVLVTNWPANQTIHGTVTAVGSVTPGDSLANPIDCIDAASFLLGWNVTSTHWERIQSDAGALIATIKKPQAATITYVSPTLLSQLLLAANVARKGFQVYNNTSQNLYLSLGAAADVDTGFTLIMQPGGYYEDPYNFPGNVYGIWAISATGKALVTELV